MCFKGRLAIEPLLFLIVFHKFLPSHIFLVTDLISPRHLCHSSALAHLKLFQFLLICFSYRRCFAFVSKFIAFEHSSCFILLNFASFTFALPPCCIYYFRLFQGSSNFWFLLLSNLHCGLFYSYWFSFRILLSTAFILFRANYSAPLLAGVITICVAYVTKIVNRKHIGWWYLL